MQYSSSLFSKKNNSIIHNKFILYFILIISLADLFYLSVERDFVSILSFILIGFLFSFFTKNMLIILFLALTLTNILKFGGKITIEGATGDIPSKVGGNSTGGIPSKVGGNSTNVRIPKVGVKPLKLSGKKDNKITQ